MTELWLIRHGESLGNVDGTQGDTDLSAKGTSQATALAGRLREMGFDLVLTSPLLRARRSAELAIPGVTATVEPRLHELVVPPETFMGTAGLNLRELAALLETAPADDERTETGLEFIARVRGWLAELAALPHGTRVIAFSHFAVVRECLRLLGPSPAPQVIEHCTVHRVTVEGLT